MNRHFNSVKEAADFAGVSSTALLKSIKSGSPVGL